MAQKKITDLTLRSSVVDACNFVVDDGVQTYRVTALQLFQYLRPKFSGVRTISADGTPLTEDDILVLLDPTSASFTQDLPACGDVPEGLIIQFKVIATNGNTVTLDGDGAELIDNAATLELGSSPSMDGVKLYNTGAKWLIL